MTDLLRSGRFMTAADREDLDRQVEAFREFSLSPAVVEAGITIFFRRVSGGPLQVVAALRVDGQEIAQGEIATGEDVGSILTAATAWIEQSVRTGKAIWP